MNALRVIYTSPNDKTNSPAVIKMKSMMFGSKVVVILALALGGVAGAVDDPAVGPPGLRLSSHEQSFSRELQFGFLLDFFCFILPFLPFCGEPPTPMPTSMPTGSPTLTECSALGFTDLCTARNDCFKIGHPESCQPYLAPPGGSCAIPTIALCEASADCLIFAPSDESGETNFVSCASQTCVGARFTQALCEAEDGCAFLKLNPNANALCVEYETPSSGICAGLDEDACALSGNCDLKIVPELGFRATCTETCG